MQFPTEDEAIWIRLYVLLPQLVEYLDADRKMIESSAARMRTIYAAWIDSIIDRILSDIANVKKNLRSRKIHIYEEYQDDFGYHVKYKIRGYHNFAEYRYAFAEALIRELAKEYLEGK